MKTYRAKFNPDSKNVYGVSLVENPAMEGDFIQFSKQKDIKFADVDKDKRRIMGLILEPNKLVYRNQGGQEFNIVFTEQDIEDVAYNFQKQSNQKTSTIEHSNSNIEGVTFVETWLVENPEIDKSANFGFSYPKGSWLGVMQIDNEEVWLEYVKTGKVKGFSIDAFMQLEEVNLNKVDMSDDKKDNVVLEAITNLSNLVKDAFKPEKAQGNTKKVDLNEDKQDKEDVKVEFKKEDLALFLNEIKEVINPLKDENVALKNQVEDFKAKFEKQEERLVELEKQPSTTNVSKNARALDLSKPYEQMTNREKMEYNRNKM